MGNLRRASREAVLEKLDAGIYSRSAFIADFNITGGPTIRLIFRDNPAFVFEARDLANGMWSTSEAPGQHFLEPERDPC